MTALKIIGIVLLVCLLISFLRLGVVAELGDELRVKLRIGPLRLTLLPKKEKKPKAEKPKKPKKEKSAAAKKHPLPKPSFAELRTLVRTALDALGKTLRRTCKRTRIDPLELCVTFAGDPAEAAKNYGYANAAIWSVMPHLEELFYIPAPSITLRMDFQAEKTRVEGTVGVTLRVCDLLAIVLTLALPLGKWFFAFQRAHAKDVPPAPPEGMAQTAAPETAANGAQPVNATGDDTTTQTTGESDQINA